MAIIPKKIHDDLFDGWMDYPFKDLGFHSHNEPFFKKMNLMMKTDVKELSNGYELNIELPGYQKEDIKIELNKGYLNISASNSSKIDEKSDNGTYLRQERYCGKCSRSFFVGEEITEQDIKAKFINGVLQITFPKINPEQNNGRKYIDILD